MKIHEKLQHLSSGEINILLLLCIPLLVAFYFVIKYFDTIPRAVPFLMASYGLAICFYLANCAKMDGRLLWMIGILCLGTLVAAVGIAAMRFY